MILLRVNKDSIYNCTRATSVNEIIQDTPASMLRFRWWLEKTIIRGRWPTSYIWHNSLWFLSWPSILGPACPDLNENWSQTGLEGPRPRQCLSSGWVSRRVGVSAGTVQNVQSTTEGLGWEQPVLACEGICPELWACDEDRFSRVFLYIVFKNQRYKVPFFEWGSPGKVVDCTLTLFN